MNATEFLNTCEEAHQLHPLVSYLLSQAMEYPTEETIIYEMIHHDQHMKIFIRYLKLFSTFKYIIFLKNKNIKNELLTYDHLFLSTLWSKLIEKAETRFAFISYFTSQNVSEDNDTFIDKRAFILSIFKIPNALPLLPKVFPFLKDLIEKTDRIIDSNISFLGKSIDMRLRKNHACFNLYNKFQSAFNRNDFSPGVLYCFLKQFSSLIFSETDYKTSKDFVIAYEKAFLIPSIHKFTADPSSLILDKPGELAKLKFTQNKIILLKNLYSDMFQNPELYSQSHPVFSTFFCSYISALDATLETVFSYKAIPEYIYQRHLLIHESITPLYLEIMETKDFRVFSSLSIIKNLSIPFQLFIYLSHRPHLTENIPALKNWYKNSSKLYKTASLNSKYFDNLSAPIITSLLTTLNQLILFDKDQINLAKNSSSTSFQGSILFQTLVMSLESTCIQKSTESFFINKQDEFNRLVQLTPLDHITCKNAFNYLNENTSILIAFNNFKNSYSSKLQIYLKNDSISKSFIDENQQLFLFLQSFPELIEEALSYLDDPLTLFLSQYQTLYQNTLQKLSWSKEENDMLIIAMEHFNKKNSLLFSHLLSIPSMHEAFNNLCLSDPLLTPHIYTAIQEALLEDNHHNNIIHLRTLSSYLSPVSLCIGAWDDDIAIDDEFFQIITSNHGFITPNYSIERILSEGIPSILTANNHYFSLIPNFQKLNNEDLPND
ncbi:hypothetical protein CLAVI_000504 [Candidatus Clavichlamydia salmonicola]|uniref:hypothetical protein n=1 Tax=Candidatus Clavichlamydia salmonicola TaxID=469812 RepID=UPI001891E46A|nr:hypothetical protein [Candidatus Clavichlamydia salmonicola]MBF5050882.1 hypothetical protein [Candidatus Clavichlamydia salmonicola]